VRKVAGWSDQFARDALPDQIARRVLSLITERQLKPGERLPPERELAGAMGVSRSSLREALRALSMLGVTDMRHGDGTYVTTLEPAGLMRPLGLVLSLSDAGFEDLFEARKVVEPPLAALAAERATAADLDALARCADTSAAVAGDDDAFMRNDLELHGLISRAARNLLLARLAGSLGELAIASRIATTGVPGLKEQSVLDHRAIVEAITARDPEAAAAAMRTHIENVERRRLATRREEEDRT
jgi:GntR family transcriptional repressor for pyruvate dehydrogenase complex